MKYSRNARRSSRHMRRQNPGSTKRRLNSKKIFRKMIRGSPWDLIMKAGKLVKKTGKLIAGFARGRPKILQKFLRKFGKRRIVSIEVGRNPIQDGFQKLIDVFGGGRKVRKKFNYDAFFHLFMMIHLDDGKIFRIEKNSLVTVTKPPDKISAKRGPFPTDVVVEEWLANAERAYGINRLYTYTMDKHNCQAFVNQLAKSAGVHTPELQEFVVQHTEELHEATAVSVTNVLINTGAAYAETLLDKLRKTKSYTLEYSTEVPEVEEAGTV